MAKKVNSKEEKIEENQDNVFNFESTKEIVVPSVIIDQVIGQDEAVKVMKKAALQRRHVLLIGEPGTGKSLLGIGLAELLPKEQLVDVISFINPHDENQPLIRTVPAGTGRKFILDAKAQNQVLFKNQNILSFVLIIGALIAPWLAYYYYSKEASPVVGAIMFAALLIGGMVSMSMFLFLINLGRRAFSSNDANKVPPKLIVDNFKRKTAPFYDATGAHAGALLGDVLHDPLQSGGLGTPAHERVVAGLIHKANKGVLFIDEIATLDPVTQQELLTALQEGKFAITGQSERSAGAMVRTEPVPCQFILVAAGNVDTIKNMHPALRSRIRGYGYEIYMKDTMLDNSENRMRIARFIAQEVEKDKKIPHFSKDAVIQMIEEAKRSANRKGHLTLRLRELGGLVRAAGDIAIEEKAKLVTKEHLIKAKEIARTLEKQLADRYIERKKEYEVIVTEGKKIGRVNGLAVIGGSNSYSGIILPIDAEIAPGGKGASIIATGKLGEIAKEAITNVSAIIKKNFGETLKGKYDIYVQFLQTYEGVEGDSASVAVATAIISALKKIPIEQSVAMTGSLSVRGEVLPIGGVSAKVEAALSSGIKKVIVPRSNLKDIVVDKELLKRGKIVPVDTIKDVLREAMDFTNHSDILSKFE